MVKHDAPLLQKTEINMCWLFLFDENRPFESVVSSFGDFINLKFKVHCISYSNSLYNIMVSGLVVMCFAKQFCQFASIYRSLNVSGACSPTDTITTNI